MREDPEAFKERLGDYLSIETQFLVPAKEIVEDLLFREKKGHSASLMRRESDTRGLQFTVTAGYKIFISDSPHHSVKFLNKAGFKSDLEMEKEAASGVIDNIKSKGLAVKFYGWTKKLYDLFELNDTDEADLEKIIANKILAWIKESLA